MRKGVLYSTALHAAVIAVAWLGVPSLFRPPPVAPTISVELVMEEPAKKPKPKPRAAKPRPPPAKAPPAPPPAPDIPPPPQTALAMPEPAPEPPPPKAKPKPKPKAVPKPKPAPVKQVAAPPPRSRPKPPPPKAKPKPKPKPDPLQAILKNLAKDAQRAREQKQAALPEKPALPRPAATPRRSALETRQLEQVLILAVRQQLTPCWNIPAGAKDAQEMHVGIRIRLSPDGTLRGAPVILDTNRLATDPFYRAVAESAVRALLNPECRPLRLPLDQYDIWKEITFNFDPGEALGR